MNGYKGFKKGMICNPSGRKPKQYAENTVYEEDTAKICHSGMHFCENPFDVLDFYPLVDENGDLIEIAEVEALDEVKTDDNKKFCTKKIKIGAKLNFSSFIQAAIDFIFEKTEKNNDSGDWAKIGSSGDGAKIGSSGDWAKIGSSGYGAQIGSSGYGAQIGSSGDWAKIGSSGYGAKIGSSGYGAKIGSSGYGAQIGSSGYGAQIGSSGDWAKIGSSGDWAVIAAIGLNSMAKGKKGSWITLAEWKFDKEKAAYIPICVKTRKIDGKRLKEDTFYKLVDGKFQEVGG